MDKQSRILIVGAGPTGLTAALELFRHGFRPRIIDRKQAPSPLSRAVGIAAHSLELLEASGAAGKLLARGQKMREMYVHENGRRIGTLRLGTIPHRYNFLLSLPQNETEETMSAVLETMGGRVEYGRSLTSLRISGDKALATINGGAEETWDLVIGADGIHSKVRDSLGIPFNGYDYPTRWSIADFESRDWPGETGDAYLLPGGHLRFVVRIGPRRFRVVADQPAAMPGIPVAFTPDTVHREDDFIISIRQAETYQRHPVYLAGDAAHVHSPAGARGMNLGIEDAHELARRVSENALEGYTPARHPISARWIRLSERMVRGMLAKSLPARLLRRAALAVFSACPRLQRPLLMRVSGLVE